MIKVSWHAKGSNSSRQVLKATIPGKIVSVDHLISTQPGFIAQLKGKLTTKQYKAETVFVDHFSGFRRTST